MWAVKVTHWVSGGWGFNSCITSGSLDSTRKWAQHKQCLWLWGAKEAAAGRAGTTFHTSHWTFVSPALTNNSLISVTNSSNSPLTKVTQALDSQSNQWKCDLRGVSRLSGRVKHMCWVNESQMKYKVLWEDNFTFASAVHKVSDQCRDGENSENRRRRHVQSVFLLC